MPDSPTPPDALPQNLPDEQETSAPSSGISYGKASLSILFSLAVLGVVGYFTFDPSEFRRLLTHPDPWFLGICGAMIVLRVLLCGMRLSYASNRRLSLKEGLRGQLAWDFFSSLTPSALGGGPLAAVYISRDSKMSIGETTALLLFCMLLDQFWFATSIPLILITALFLPVFPPAMGSIGTGVFVAFALGMLGWTVLFAYATLYRPDLIQKATDLVFRIKWLRRFRARVAQEMSQLNERARILRAQSLWFFVRGVLLTGGGWMCRYLLTVFVVMSVFTDFDKVLFFLRIAAMTLVSIVLPTPGGSGGVEGLYVLFLGPLMPKTLVAPTLLTWRLLSYYLYLGLGVFLSMHHVQKSMRRKRKAARAARNGLTSENGVAETPSPAETAGPADA